MRKLINPIFWALTPLVALAILWSAALSAAVLSTAVSSDSPVDGETPVRGSTEAQRKGFEIAARSDRSDRGFKDNEVTLSMILRNAAGEESRRALVITTLEVPDENEGDKSLILFETPRDIEGTALLSHAKILDPDNQWLFLPSLKRVKRISSRNKSGPFVGSEFAFEDFTSVELNKYDYEYLREEACGELKCDVVVRYPRYENSGYTKQIVWIDQQYFQVRKIDFYNRRDALLKTLTLEGYLNYNGYWRAHTVRMVNHQTNKSTDLVYGEYKFNVGLKETDFVKGRLSRLR
ncbi:outer membrane lipoprotein-sorting protein [Litoribrevibacter albus]|uniref:Membrane protein n=1 Tax=Litoribrevibacter albus TaxID=1473156 RepID=A0AA37W4R0_9GAMM|nr:outer membrane lipoprotein-sorting protein [Litoribrevibacter albus]GLQ30342.1 membrane protein [Litoribrevibacter albus]